MIKSTKTYRRSVGMGSDASNRWGASIGCHPAIRATAILIVVGVMIGAFGIMAVSAQTMSDHSAAMMNVPAIRIKQDAVVDGDHIRLKDLLYATSDSRLVRTLGNIVLGYSPRPGNKKKLTGSWIVSKLRSNKRVSPETRIAAPSIIRVSRAHQALDPKRMEKLLVRYVGSRVGNADFKISQFKIRGSNRFPTGKLTLTILKPMPKKLSGRVNLRMAVATDRKEWGRVTLSGWVDRFETVVCAGRYLSRGTILTAGDLTLKSMNTSKAPANLVNDLQDAVGKRIKQHLKAGANIRHNMLAVPPVIKKGDRVKLVARSGALRIVTLGIAKGSGGVGDQIRIENMASKKTVMGRITSASSVEVLF